MILSGRIADVAHVPESRFGQWFLATDTWAVHVLTRAIDDLERLIADRRAAYPVAVDVGCGFGRSFRLLQERFSAERLIGVDIETEALARSARQAERDGLTVELVHASSSDLPLPSRSADIVFCHQTLHHLVEQENALREFHRILKPGGLFLLAESTRAYIHSWIIRLLFRHPMHVQRTADEYLAMVRAAGFSVDPSAVSYPYLWWSRQDLGLAERLLGIKPTPGHEETLINLVAVKRPQ
ncbi:MAG: class I SAM-dependent methyltransferase [Alphaproteobacteria bacterium]|nr:class I SAM-dependent methyltransferase [Alphaproteobacteria bacterium]